VEAPNLEMLVSATKPKQPYPGLRPFEPEEWSIFFGRETMIDDVIERLAAQRVVLIHGASGSGKSSLVRAGVLPKLARQHLRHGVKWLTCAMRPSGGPLWNLARELARLEGRENDFGRVTHIIRLFNKRGATLASVVNSLDGLEDKRLCLLVDQFEELFRFERETSREEAELFVDLLIGAIAVDDVSSRDSNAIPITEACNANIHVAITMRSEFLGECARFSGFAEAINRTQYLVPRMRYETLLRAIRRPAQLYGGEITIELAERLVADVRGREDELPLIQHGLMLLWNAAATTTPGESIRLDVEQFEHAGGLTQLLSDHADHVMTAATPSKGSTDTVEQMFRALTDINAEGRAIRRPQSFGKLVAVCGISPGDLRKIIDAFREDGVSLLTPYFPAAIEDKTVIDISHEALIRCWNRIADPQNGWLGREFQDGLIWRSLLNDAKEFEIDRKHILSPAATTQRVKWFVERNSSWSERYGGSWDLVRQLLQASRRMAIRSTRIRRLLMTPVIFLAAVAMVLLLLSKNLVVGSAIDFLAYLAAAFMFVAAAFMFVLVILLIVDYSHQFIPSEHVRTRLVWYAFFVAAFSYLASKFFDVSASAKSTIEFFSYFAAGAAGIWIILAIAPILLGYVPSRIIASPLIRLFGIEPAIHAHREAVRATVSLDDSEHAA
jgi:energy-coupling factor transporter ATP-binding protein EcfA2